MKKIVIIEVAVLAVLLVAALVLCIVLPRPAELPDVMSTDSTTLSTEDTTESTEETTLPPESTTESTPPETTDESTPPETSESIPPETDSKIVPTWNTYPSNWKIEAKNYFVYDSKENTFLVNSSSADTRVYPASITKLLTAYVALQYLDLNTQIIAGSELELISPDSSLAMIYKGDVLTVEQLVEAMLLPSGNDAAYVLAAAAGRAMANGTSVNTITAIENFVNQMNASALSAGMTGSHFVNPDGMHDPDHYMTLGDMAILGKLALGNSTMMRYAGKSSSQTTLHGTTVKWVNTNILINPESSLYCPYAIGLKTGQTNAAGSCLLSAFRMGDRELIIGVFGCPEGKYRFDDTLCLFNKIVLS